MPYYPRTSYHSHRHPFLGPGDLIDLDNPISVEAALAADAADATAPGGTTGAAAPTAGQKPSAAMMIFDGLMSGVAVYGISKAFKVNARTAFQIGFVTAGTAIAMGYVSAYLQKALQKTAAPPTAPVNTQPPEQPSQPAGQRRP